MEEEKKKRRKTIDSESSKTATTTATATESKDEPEPDKYNKSVEDANQQGAEPPANVSLVCKETIER